MRGLLLRLASAAGFVLAVFACTNDDSGAASSSSSGAVSGPDANESSSNGSSGTSTGSSGTSTGTSGSDPPERLVTITTETMEFGGKTRTYLLATPKSYDANKSYPLVLSFHGNPGTAQGRADGLPFDSVSKSDAVIAYPQADSNDWDLYTPTDGNADMSWIHALPDDIAAKVNIDRGRILGYGYSGGGFFLTQFTCRFGDVFKAISINAGGGPDEEQMGYGQYENGCFMCPGGPVATIVTHGDADPEVEPGSGEFTHACYATFNGCSDSLSPTTPAPCQQHDGCPADKPVKWCLIPGQGHGPWAASMKEAWAFFIALP